MSGIAGMVNPFEDIVYISSNLSEMSRLIHSRGTAGAGQFLTSNAVLLRRVGSEEASLNQPLIAEETVNGKDYVLLLDGVIFNMEELRTELSGSIPCSDLSVQQLLIHAFCKWNTDLFRKLNGIFAIALWVKEDKNLILIRDQIGVKPLYYALTDKSLVFSSHIKGITGNPMINVKMDNEGLSELICLSPRHTPGSAVFHGVHELRPGHFITYSPEGFKSQRYWKIEERKHEDDIDKTFETIRELISDSVKRQIKTNTPLCGYLSGGLYSSIITSIVSSNPELLYGDVYNTWSVDYESDNGNKKQRAFTTDSDTPWVRWMCRKFGTRHHYIVLSSDDLAGSLLDAAEVRGFPGMADYDSSLLLLNREIQKDFNIVLSGECPDEIFGSNLRQTGHLAHSKKKLPWATNLAEKLSVFNTEIINMIKPYEFIEKCYEEALAEYLKFSVNSGRLDKEYEAQWFCLYWNLPSLMERLDTMGMAFGLETRVPLCDVRLIEYFWNIPQGLKRYNNRDRGLIREAMGGIIPQDIAARRKNPWPLTLDPEYEVKMKNMIMERIFDPGSPLKNLLNLKTLQSMMNQNYELSKPYTARSQFYGWLIQLDYFFRANGITAF